MNACTLFLTSQSAVYTVLSQEWVHSQLRLAFPYQLHNQSNPPQAYPKVHLPSGPSSKLCQGDNEL